MTMGTATANSILLVSYARERLAVHGDALRAAVEAGKGRIRPVLITAAAMIIGMLPMAMANSPECAAGTRRHGGINSCDPVHAILCSLRLRHHLPPAKCSPRGACLIMKNLGGKVLLFLVVCTGLVFLVYRFSGLQQEAAALHKDAQESAVTPVALTHFERAQRQPIPLRYRALLRVGTRRPSMHVSKAT